jgi:hypothetical protein
MPLFSWRRKQTNGQPQARPAAAPKLTRRFRPQLEALEGREVPSTLTVTNNFDSGAGSLRAEIAAAHSGDTIDLSGLSGQTITLTSGQLVLNKSLTIQGPGAGQLTISGGLTWRLPGHRLPSYTNATRVFEVTGTGTNVTLSGLTITDGSSYGPLDAGAFAGDGGAILNADGSTLTVSGCTVSNSIGYDGGGIYNFGATLKLVNSSLSANLANGESGDGPDGEGGGLCTIMGATVSVTDCTLSGNTANTQGGGVWFSGPTMAVNGCTFSGNVAGGAGGPFGYVPATGNDIYSRDTLPLLTVSDSLFTNNTPYRFFPIEGPWTNGGGNTFG